jgi:hypothetical protein
LKNNIRIIIFLISLILISGCISENKQSKNHSENIDYKLTLEIDNQSLNDNINFTIKLINIKETSISIINYFQLAINYLDLFIIGPDNITLDILSGNLNIDADFITLYPNEYLQLNVSLRNEYITYVIANDDGTFDRLVWNWEKKGKYTVWAVFQQKYKSNVIEFEII